VRSVAHRGDLKSAPPERRAKQRCVAGLSDSFCHRRF